MLKEVEDLNSQLTIFKTYLQVDSVNHYVNYQKVYMDLFQSIFVNYPYCQIHPFGSTVTGLCFKNSDVDVYISGIYEGCDKAVQYLYSIREILLKSRKFTNTIVIAHAKIPIVKCIHKETHICCDINIKNMLGVCNSKLIKYYLSIDEKIKHMMIVLKYWGKVHKITGQNHLFTNYSLYMMVIFFLQQKPFYFPSVLCLQRDDRFYIPQDSWNGGFKALNVYRSTIETLRKMTFLEMLAGFFEFYSKFQYNTLVICPYLGKSIEKELFKTPEALPRYFNIYKQFVGIETNQPLKFESCICIQDPFEHARNTTSVILETVLERFVGFSQLAMKLCDAGSTNLFYKLFTEDLHFEKKVAQISRSNISDTSTIVFTYSPKNSETSSEEMKKEAWFETVTEFMKIVLKDFMDFEIQENLEPLPAKNMRDNDQTEVHDQRSVHLKCSGKLNVWDNRKNQLKRFNKEFETNNFLEREIAVTEFIKKNCGITPTIVILEFEFVLKFSVDPGSVEVNIKKISCYKNTFRNFSVYFMSHIKSWFAEYERMFVKYSGPSI